MSGLNGILGRKLKPKILSHIVPSELEEEIIEFLTDREEGKDIFVLGLDYSTATDTDQDKNPVVVYSVIIWYHEVDYDTFNLGDLG